MSQTLSSVCDGITRHNVQGMWFRRYSEVYGFKSALEWRDLSNDIPEGNEVRRLIVELDAIVAVQS